MGLHDWRRRGDERSSPPRRSRQGPLPGSLSLAHPSQILSLTKPLYQGISDTPAWVVATANTYAKLSGKTPFVIYQGAWSVLSRDFEREILPMARQHGLALAPWNVLAGGKIRTDEEEERRRKTGENGQFSLQDQAVWLITASRPNHWRSQLGAFRRSEEDLQGP